jgi:hypothetical protein
MDVKTSMIGTHVRNCGALGLRSPAGLIWRKVHVVRGPANYMYYCGSISPNLMLALDSVEGLEHPWAWFAEGPGEAGVVLRTSQ